MASGKTDRIVQDVERIEAAGSSMDNLLEDLLSFSKAGKVSLRIQPLAFKQLVTEAMDQLEGQIQKHHIAIEVHDPLPAVMADQDRTVQVIQNLIENAIKYKGNQPKPAIHIGYNNAKHHFYIQDNGKGIALEDQQRVFELFERGTNDVPGSGIGLAIVKRFIELQHGRIWVQSNGKAMQGTAFNFTLPIINHQ